MRTLMVQIEDGKEKNIAHVFSKISEVAESPWDMAIMIASYAQRFQDEGIYEMYEIFSSLLSLADDDTVAAIVSIALDRDIDYSRKNGIARPRAVIMFFGFLAEYVEEKPLGASISRMRNNSKVAKALNELPKISKIEDIFDISKSMLSAVGRDRMNIAASLLVPFVFKHLSAKVQLKEEHQF